MTVAEAGRAKLASGALRQAYEQNPVLMNPGIRDFRDPKVFWHEESEKWIMVVSHPLAFKVQFYQSEDLIEWTLSGEFGGVGDVSKIWECPDLLKKPRRINIKRDTK